MLTVWVLVCAMMALTRAEALPEEKAEKDDQAAEIDLVARTFRYRCPRGWSRFNRRCFHFVPRPMTWAQAERNCRSMRGNLASVHSVQEYHKIQKLIMKATHGYKPTWIGGSDAQEDTVWLWSDGTTFHYSNWCRGEPNNYFGWQNCIQINYGDQKCWDDLQCNRRLPSICAKKAQ
uniref:C-type lectin domain-containing protein n=1 Tax=Lates calcarifer TaxID=8187 RepID=A0A4W6BPC8_LATCA